MTRRRHPPGVDIRPAVAADAAEWLRMRTALWPEAPDDHPGEILACFERPPPQSVTLVAALGYAEVAEFVCYRKTLE